MVAYVATMMNLFYRHVGTRGTAWWADLLLFKAAWVSLVLFRDAGVVPGLVLIALKMLFWPSTPQMLAVTLVVLVMGIAMDLGLIVMGVYRFDHALMPLWLALLWLAFALTVPRAFACIGKLHLLLQSCCGMLAGLFGYLAGYFVGAVGFGYPLPATCGVIAVCWAVLAPLSFLAERKLQGR